MEADGFDSLVRKAQSGDRAAMDQVIEILRPQIEPLARQYANPTKPVESTADLLQESCLRAWNKIGTFEGGGNDEDTLAMFRSWIGQIVKRLGVNARQARDAQKRSPGRAILPLERTMEGDSTLRGPTLEPPARGPSPTTIAREGELSQRIQKALEGLPDEVAAIVRMHFFEGQPFTEISRRLGLTYEQVRNRYEGTMERLERELDGFI